MDDQTICCRTPFCTPSKHFLKSLRSSYPKSQLKVPPLRSSGQRPMASWKDALRLLLFVRDLNEMSRHGCRNHHIHDLVPNLGVKGLISGEEAVYVV